MKNKNKLTKVGLGLVGLVVLLTGCTAATGNTGQGNGQGATNGQNYGNNVNNNNRVAPTPTTRQS